MLRPPLPPFLRRILALVGAVLLTASAQAAPAGDTLSVRIQGVVPVTCRLQVDLDAASAGTGTLNEFCNSASGYDVLVDASGEAVGTRFSVDGEEVVVAAAGPTHLSASAGPASRARRLSILTPPGAAAGALSFRIVPRSTGW